jgi:hypothetical protein
MTNGIGGFIPSFILDILMRSFELDLYPFRSLTFLVFVDAGEN